jgi:hypothetical protein
MYDAILGSAPASVTLALPQLRWALLCYAFRGRGPLAPAPESILSAFRAQLLVFDRRSGIPHAATQSKQPWDSPLRF